MKTGIYYGSAFGLPLDFDNQSDKTQARLEAWAAQIASEVGALTL